MNHEEQMSKNFAWSTISQIATRVLGLAFFVYMSYMLKEKGIGQYNFISSFVVFWFIISDFGAGGFLYREWSRGDVEQKSIEKDFNLVFTMRLIVASFIFIPFFITNWFLNKEIIISLVLYYLAVFLSLTINLADSYLNSVNNFKLVSIRSFIEKMGVILIGAILLLFFHNVEMVFFAIVVSQFISIYYYFSKRFPFKPRIVFDYSRIKKLIVNGLPFVFITLFVSLYSRIDIVMLKFMKDFETVGWYGTAYKFYDVANIFPAILFLPSVFPVLSKINRFESKEKLKDFFNRLLRILFCFGLLTSIFLIFTAPFLVNTFFPASFYPSILAIRILILTLIIGSFSLLFYNLLIIQNREKISLKIIIISCIINIILNIILIPKYSLYGAAWATLIAELVNLFLLQYYVSWEKDSFLIRKISALFIFNVCLMFVVKSFGYMNNLLIGAAYFFFNVFLIYFLKLLNKQDFQIFILPIKNKIQNIFINQNNTSI